MPATGETCIVAGIYEVLGHARHARMIAMPAGFLFPPCKECRERVVYRLITLRHEGPHTKASSAKRT